MRKDFLIADLGKSINFFSFILSKAIKTLECVCKQLRADLSFQSLARQSENVKKIHKFSQFRLLFTKSVERIFICKFNPYLCQMHNFSPLHLKIFLLFAFSLYIYSSEENLNSFFSHARCQSFLQASYIKSQEYFLFFYPRHKTNERKKARLISHQILYTKKRSKNVTDILQFADAPANPFILSLSSKPFFLHQIKSHQNEG